VNYDKRRIAFSSFLKSSAMKLFFATGRWRLLSFIAVTAFSFLLISSSHREAPLISNDPLADNTDLYAFRNPYHPNKVVIIANYIPGQLPQGGPNYYSFGEHIRYEIHIDNNIATKGDDIIYRFTFKKNNEDPTTFFNIRQGKENLKTTYTLERSKDGGLSFQTIVVEGKVPPPNIGPRSISSAVGLNAPDYNTLITQSITTASTGEKVFAGTADDPFFVDLGGIFDLGDAPRTTGSHPQDGLKCLNVSTLALEIDISTLQKNGQPVSQAANILDPNYVIGVWASASRQKMRVLNDNGTETHSGTWVQVSRLGMPLTNEVIIPIGYKDYWNSLTPYEDLANLSVFGNFFYNPELALYMDDAKFGGAIPALKPLRIQKNSLGQFGFGNGQNGLFGLKGTSAVAGTALDDAVFGTLLLPGSGKPRSVDIFPVFYTGVPNLRPYQLAVGKNGNPLAEGKPVINNFLPTGGDMLRLNMAVPPTPRNDPDFSPLGIIQAGLLGLTDPRFNTSKKLEFIPNMDGFPNGRRLEDDATRIELQTVSGIALAALGLWYDDFTPGGSPFTDGLNNVYNYSTGIDKNDIDFKTTFPYEQSPWAGTTNCPCDVNQQLAPSSIPKVTPVSEMGLATPEIIATATPNPVTNTNTVRYKINKAASIQVVLYDASGKPVKVLVNKKQPAGIYNVQWNAAGLANGVYFISVSQNGTVKQTIQLSKQ
jgi:hypothetical protein